MSWRSNIPVLDLDPFDEDVLERPYEYDAALRDAGPLFWLDRYSVVGMARHNEVAAALKDWSSFGSERGVGLVDFAKEPPWRAPSLLLETDPPIHDQMRAVMNKIVSLSALKNAADEWRATADRLVDALCQRRGFDAVKDIAEVFPLQVFPDTIGIRRDGRQHLLPYAAAVFDAYGPKNRVWEGSQVGLVEASEWVEAACRREHLQPDGWGEMVYRAADSGQCTHDEAHRLVRSFLSAGIDTTVNGIGNLLLAFSENPEQWSRLRADPSLVKRAFDEALRWDSTVQIFFRTTTRPVEVAGTLIPEGQKVLLFLAAANRDTRRWEEADKFDIGRNSSGHVGFGFGLHQCLGQMVARQEAQILLEAMIPRISEFRPTSRPTRRLNNSLHALSSLPIEIETA